MARRILLADDSVTAQNMGRRILSDAGYEVITVNNGSAALKKVAEQAPDVIVLDVYMPGYGGLEVCQRLKEVQETARIPILLTVGKLEPFKPDEARRVRADGFIIKPFEATELLAALTKLEDKIVPQSAAPKAGKVRSIAPEPGRSEEDTGWKNRLSIPPGGKGRSPEGLEADDFGQHVPAEPVALKPVAVDEKLAAVADPVASNSASNEEKASPAAEIASATAQVEAPQAQSSKVQEISSGNLKAAELANPELLKPEPPKADQSDTRPTQPEGENKTGISAVAAEPVKAAETVAAVVAAVPTSAVETYSGPRWIAESAVLSADDTAFPLDREMEKSLAASAAYSAGLEAVEQKQSPKEVSVTVESAVNLNESVVPGASVAETKNIEDSETKFADTRVAETRLAETKLTEAKASEPSTPAELPVVAATADVQPADAVGEVIAPLKPEAYAAAASMGSAAGDSIVAETRIPAVSIPAEESNAAQATNGSKQQLAAAWEQWQNVRETVLNSPVAEQITEAAAASLKSALTSESSPKNVSEIEIEATLTSKPSNPTAIASIVDSVLAELKPKLMEEIARKMSAEKKSE